VESLTTTLSPYVLLVEFLVFFISESNKKYPIWIRVRKTTSSF